MKNPVRAVGLLSLCLWIGEIDAVGKEQGRPVRPVKPSGAVSEDEASLIEKQIESERRALKNIAEKIEAGKNKTTAAQKEETSILLELETVDRTVRLGQQESAILEGNIKKKEKGLLIMQRDIQNLQKEISGIRLTLSMRIRDLYQERQEGFLRILFASKDPSDFLRRFYYVKTIAIKEEERLASLRVKQVALQETEEKWTQSRQGWVNDKAHLVQKLALIRLEKENKKKILTRIQNEKALYKKTVTEMETAASLLQNLIDEKIKKRSRIEKGHAGRFDKEKGKLIWPSDGKVITSFGRQRHPKYKSYIFKKGVEIDASHGEAVRAVYDGTVVYANWLHGYGMVLMVDQGGGYYVIYAHLKKLLVAEGTSVTKRQRVGEIGETGLAQGDRLYFEIRYQGSPVDPLMWLIKR